MSNYNGSFVLVPFYKSYFLKLVIISGSGANTSKSINLSPGS
jgi:hypothetical protein